MANLTITVTVDDADELVLKNDIVDIDSWVQDAVSGKIHNCWKRMQSNWTVKLMNDPSFTDPLPSNKEDFVSLVTSRDDYMDRAARDAAKENLINP